MISTFGGFSTAKLGIRASQQGLQITGNNITNINTNGYTRQRINQVSLYGGATDRYASETDVRMGMGTLVSSVSQIRDPFLDIRYRNEAANVGFHDEKLAHLEELKNILDEVMKDGIHTGLEGIRTQLQNLTKNPTGQENDKLVQGACQTLISLLNKYAADLQGQKQDALQGFDQNVDGVNKILTQIRDLNVEIRKSQLHGDPALEMLDNRNMLIDQLAEMTKIKVTYTEEKISEGISVSKLTIELDAPGQDPASRPVLIDGSFANKLEIKPLGPDGKPDASVEDYDISLGGLTDPNGDSPIVAEMKKEMQKLNNQLKSLDSLNQKFKDLTKQRQNWTTEAQAHKWTETTFNDPTEREKTIKELDKKISDAQDAVKNAKDDVAKEQAQKQLQAARDERNAFNTLDKQNTELTKQKTNLEQQRDNTVNALKTALQNQGLTLTHTNNANTGEVTLSVNGPNLGGNVDLLKPNDPNFKIPSFGTKVDPNTGDLTLQLNNQDFKKIDSFGEIEKQLNSLNDQLQALHDVNKKLSALQEQRKKWDTAIKNADPAWTEQTFTKDYKTTLDDLKKELDDARKDYDAADAADKEAELKKVKAAQEKLKTFSELKQQYDDMEAKKTALDAKVQPQFDALKDTLKKQGLDATMDPATHTAGAVFSISITGGTLNQPIKVIDSAKPADPPKQFGTSIDANTGNLSLKLGNDAFKEIPKGQFDKTAHELDSLKDGKLYGVLEADLQFLNGKGEFGNPSTEIRGIAYYQRSLDTLAQTFAETMNKLNEHPDHPDENRNLFESNDPNNKNITASNISISKGWESGKVHITQYTDPSAGAGDNSNIHNMIAALNNTNQAFKVVDKDGNVVTDDNGKEHVIFTGSFETMFTNMNTTLGNDMSTTATLLNRASITANERAVARDNVSSVDLNEEGINLIQYQKSFAAACRVMTTLDEMLDSLLNVKR